MKKSYLKFFKSISFEQFLISIICIQLLCFVCLSYSSRFAVSELWSLSLSRDFLDFQNLKITHFSRFSFFLFLKPLFYFFSNNVDLIVFSRLMFAMIALGSLFVIYKLIYLITKKRIPALFCVCLLLAAPDYLYRAFRVRPDVLISFLACCSYITSSKIFYLKIRLS